MQPRGQGTAAGIAKTALVAGGSGGARAERRQLETLVDTARGRQLDPNPINEPLLLREYGTIRFFKATYGFVLRHSVQGKASGHTCVGGRAARTRPRTTTLTRSTAHPIAGPARTPSQALQRAQVSLWEKMTLQRE